MKLLSAENKEMPTGVVSGCRQICLPVVGVHNKARLLPHLHMSLACLQLPTNSLHFCVFFFFLRGGLAQIQHKCTHAPDDNLHELCWDSTFRRASYLSWRLYFEGLGSPFPRRPRVEVTSLSVMNHSRSPEGAPGLFLKSYIILLLRGRPAFNIVMIRHCKVMYLVWIQPCMHKQFTLSLFFFFLNSNAESV